MKKILVLGGTKFIGKNFVEYIIKHHSHLYEVILANRMISNKDAFPNLESIYLNREDPRSFKASLKEKKYDFVVDFCGYTYSDIENIATFFNFNKYIFISSSAVEHLDVIKANNDQSSLIYAINKQAAENYIIRNISNYAIIRPCYVVGEDDYTDRFLKLKDNYYIWKETKVPLRYFIPSNILAELIHKEIQREENKIINPC